MSSSYDERTSEESAMRCGSANVLHRHGRCGLFVLVASLAAGLGGQAARADLQEGEILIGSRGFGSVYSPLSSAGTLHNLVTGPNLLTFDVRGAGPGLAFPYGHLSLLTTPSGQLLVRAGAWETYGVFQVDPT
jgi:hypothetical protein